MKNKAVPYLSFNSNAKDALSFYKEVFNGEITEIQTYGEADFPTPPEADDRVMHAKFKKGNLFLMMSDSFPVHEITTGNNISLVLEPESEDEIQNLYNKLSQDGSTIMELQDTFWGAKYSKVKDRFGIAWDLNYQNS